ncbi:hypothetical protein MLD38_002063 [Melastoma candidum]|uniref:Uncharacterized protein n=1 Tax=Melastoma candidum TaxID=119954 RepID=A0ACB9SF84_9MYRT|nr:hypothetical protein MLD38_002063 [Melastoma candidum]
MGQQDVEIGRFINHEIEQLGLDVLDKVQSCQLQAIHLPKQKKNFRQTWMLVSDISTGSCRRTQIDTLKERTGPNSALSPIDSISKAHPISSSESHTHFVMQRPVQTPEGSKVGIRTNGWSLNLSRTLLFTGTPDADIIKNRQHRVL